jgi:peptide deformylase
VHELALQRPADHEDLAQLGGDQVPEQLADSPAGLAIGAAETMGAAPGAGLAANQIGVALRACVVKGDDNQVYQLVNPEIVKGAGVQVGYEGCLSYPGWFGEVARYETVTVKALNRKGKSVRYKAAGFTARAFQHEIDHLDGILFTDRLTSLGSLRRVEELEAEDEEAV